MFQRGADSRAHRLQLPTNREGVPHASLPRVVVLRVPRANYHDAMPATLQRLWKRAHDIAQATCRVLLTAHELQDLS